MKNKSRIYYNFLHVRIYYILIKVLKTHNKMKRVILLLLFSLLLSLSHQDQTIKGKVVEI